MYPPPDGQDLTEEQALELDDTFLASDPFQYFSSRIASLLAWHESAPVSDAPLPEPEPASIRADFHQYLQRPAADGRPPTSAPAPPCPAEARARRAAFGR